MFLEGPAYSDAARALLSSAEPLDMAIAYVGRGASLQLGTSPEQRRILCDLISGGTNPDEVTKLCAMESVKIRHVENLHAKVMVSPTCALVGSANFSANGIGWEAGMAGNLIEAGHQVIEEVQLRRIQAWFDGLWETSLPVTESLLSQARLNWKRRQAARPRPPGSRFTIDASNWRAYLHRGIKLIIWRHVPTSEQKRREAEVPAVIARTEAARGTRASMALDKYHDFGESLNLGAGVICLDVQYLKNGTVRCQGARRTMANGHYVVRGEETVDVLDIVPVVEGQQLGPVERDALAHWLQPVVHRHYLAWCAELNPPGDTSSLVMDFDRALEAAFQDLPSQYTPEFRQLFELAKQISEPLGWRCVTVESPGPEVRIGTGLRHLKRKEVPALASVNLRLSIFGGRVRCGSYLSPDDLARYGTPLRLSAAEGRHWVQWLIVDTAMLLPQLLHETRDRLTSPRRGRRR